MNTGWTNKTSKKARKKKVAARTGSTETAADKTHKKKTKKKSRNGSNANANAYEMNDEHNEDYNNEYNNEYSPRQWRISQKISQFWPNYKCEHVLPKIITKLNLTHFDPNDEKQKIKILDCIVSELQDAMSGKSKKKKKRERERQRESEREREKEKEKERAKQKQKQKQKSKKQKKSGKFRQFMVNVGNVFLEYLDKETLSTLIRIKAFSFINNPRILTPKQRLIAYSAPNDIEFRIKSFNSKLGTLSSLKLYKFKLKKTQFNLTTTQCINIIILNNLNLDHRSRFKGTKSANINPNIIHFDLSKNSNLCNIQLTQQIIKSKCKQFNIWSATAIDDLNEAYLTQFAQYQQNNINVDGNRYLHHLNKIIVDKPIVSKQNIHSMICGYFKVLTNYELHSLHSFLCLFLELETIETETNTKQFMVWSGQCGEYKLTK